MYQEHENVSTRLQRLMQAQQNLDNEILLSGQASRARSPSPLLYPKPHSPKLSGSERAEVDNEPYKSIFPEVQPEVEDEWLRRMHANRMGLDEPAEDHPELVERSLPSSPQRSLSPRLISSPSYQSPPSRFHSWGRTEGQQPSTHEQITEALQRKLSPTMRERIRAALHQSMGGHSTESPLSPTTREGLTRAYRIADTVDQGGSYSERVLFDVLYGLEQAQGTEDRSEVEFSEFRGWLDRIFEQQNKPEKHAVTSEVLTRVRTAWRAQDTRVGAESVRELKLALRQAEQQGRDGTRYLYQLVDTDGIGTKPEFEAWCQQIFGAYPSPPRVSTPPASVSSRGHWDELQSPVFQRVSAEPEPKPVVAAPAEPSPWGERWQPSRSSTQDSYGPNTASLYSIAAAGEIAVEELNRQGYFDAELPRKEQQRWHAPDKVHSDY